MSSNIYTRILVDGTTATYIRKGTQGRKPQGFGKPKLYRLDNETITKLEYIASRLGRYYNENEIIREAAKRHVDFIYTELLKT